MNNLKAILFLKWSKCPGSIKWLACDLRFVYTVALNHWYTSQIYLTHITHRDLVLKSVILLSLVNFTGLTLSVKYIYVPFGSDLCCNIILHVAGCDKWGPKHSQPHRGIQICQESHVWINHCMQYWDSLWEVSGTMLQAQDTDQPHTSNKQKIFIIHTWVEWMLSIFLSTHFLSDRPTY